MRRRASFGRSRAIARKRLEPPHSTTNNYAPRLIDPDLVREVTDFPLFGDEKC
jgi:hypothetical protein